jgi:DNA replication protein DnaC
MAERFDQLLTDPSPDKTRVEWLWELLEPQTRARIESRVERRIRQSRLPERKTFGAFQFDFQPNLDKDLVLELATLAFLAQGKNVLLAGMSGTGKSHIAMALALNACVENRRVRYTTNADMLKDLTASLLDDTLRRTLAAYTRPELLVIDEVGLEQVERTVACKSGLMQKVILPRYQAGRSTVITSNIPWDSWGDYLEDHLGATALLDRLIHHSHVIVVDGPSWRDHHHNEEVKRAAKPRQADTSTDPPKKVPRGKTASKKTPAEKTASKKTPAEKMASKKTASKRTPAKKTPAKKARRRRGR